MSNHCLFLSATTSISVTVCYLTEHTTSPRAHCVFDRTRSLPPQNLSVNLVPALKSFLTASILISLPQIGAVLQHGDSTPKYWH